MYRKEALEAKQESADNSPRVVPVRPGRWPYLVLAGVVMLMAGLSIVVTIPATVSAQAIGVARDAFPIVTPDGGIVREWYVDAGDVVQAGTPIARIDARRIDQIRTLERELDIYLSRRLQGASSSLDMVISGLQTQLDDANRERIIRADRAGEVLRVALRAGQFAASGSTLAVIAPQPDDLTLFVLIPLAFADLVNPQAPVEWSPTSRAEESFRYTIESVIRDPMSADEAARLLGVPVESPAPIVLATAGPVAHGESAGRLRHGTSGPATITTAARPLWTALSRRTR